MCRRSLLVTAIATAAAACSSSSELEPDAAADPDAEAPVDAGIPDAGEPDASLVRWLSEEGLYEDIAEKRIDSSALEFEPAHELWSDGASKTRWLMLPAGGVIDSSDMDHWQVPVGTRVFKEFRVGEVRVETRLIEKTGPDTYWMGAYLWEEDESDAIFVELGQTNARGTGHDVPSAQDCLACHEGEPGRILGFSAIQLSHAEEPNLASIDEAGLLSDAPSEELYPVPGESDVRAALGTLHANCGSCHNPHGPAWIDTQIDLRLYVEETDPAQTAIHDTTVNRSLQRFVHPDYELRVVPGSPDDSALVYRMSVGSDVGRDRMPPLATDEIDEAGVGAVRAWIGSLEAAD
jgi:hypothetical protein